MPRVTVDFDDESHNKLELFCKTRKRTKADVIREAVKDHMDVENSAYQFYNVRVSSETVVTPESLAEMCDVRLSLTDNNGKIIKVLRGV